MIARTTTSGLHIAEGVVLPPDIVGMRMPVLAEPGAGKSVLIAVLMEELWRMRLQFVAIDPLGVGWGIKTSADGSGVGIALPYLGGTGRYADAPLRPDGGIVVARALADTGASMMLNLAEFSREEQNRFVADLWNELIRIAGRRHETGMPLSLLNLVDEASFFMPETPRGKQQARAQDAGERLARQGRGLGLGFVTPTQRPQAIDKDVIGTWEVFVLMRLIDPAAIDRAMAYVAPSVGADLAAEIRASLPTLDNGEAWIIAPRTLGFTKRVKIRMRETYDSTRTPKPGEVRRAPTTLAQADLSALRLALAAPIADESPAPFVTLPAGTTLAGRRQGGGKKTPAGSSDFSTSNEVSNEVAALREQVVALSERVVVLERERDDAIAARAQVEAQRATAIAAVGAAIATFQGKIDALRGALDGDPTPKGRKSAPSDLPPADSLAPIEAHRGEVIHAPAAAPGTASTASEAAKKAWKTRRSRSAARSEAARAAWDTRRANSNAGEAPTATPWPKPKATWNVQSASREKWCERVLTAALARYPLRLTLANLALYAGWKPSAGPYRSAIKDLRARGAIVVDDATKVIRLTAPPKQPKPKTPKERLALVRGALRPSEAKYFDVFATRGKASIETIARDVGHNSTSGPFRTAIRALLDSEIIVRSGDGYALSDDLRG